jgi:hypothetical protein
MNYDARYEMTFEMFQIVIRIQEILLYDCRIIFQALHVCDTNMLIDFLGPTDALRLLCFKVFLFSVHLSFLFH